MQDNNIVVIGGCGHVGLPLGLILCESGHRVALLDSNIDAVTQVAEGIMPFLEPGCDELLKKHLSSGRLTVTSEAGIIKDNRFVFIVIGTALDESNQPDQEGIIKLFASISRYLTSDHIVILRSTVYPGTTELLQRKFPNLRILFCPERIAEGHALEELGRIPQIIGVSGNHNADLLVKKMFSSLGVELLCTSVQKAELVKLFSNAWRYISFGVVNEIQQLLEQVGIESDEIFTLMKEKYPRCDSLPSPGFTGGPCLPKDTRQINHFFSNRFLFANTALSVHDSYPTSILERLKKTYNLEKNIVGVLGISFKPNSDDLRGSQALILLQQLRMFAKEVYYHDPLLPSTEDNLSMGELLARCDLVIVGTRHSQFQNLDIDKPIIVI